VGHDVELELHDHTLGDVLERDDDLAAVHGLGAAAAQLDRLEPYQTSALPLLRRVDAVGVLRVIEPPGAARAVAEEDPVRVASGAHAPVGATAIEDARLAVPQRGRPTN